MPNRSSRTTRTSPPVRDVPLVPTASKSNYEKTQRVLSAWKDLRPGKSFAGLSLDQFTQSIMPGDAARATIARLENELTAAMNKRDDADAAGLVLALRVVNAVKADAEEGEDGELYEAMGYVRKSERRTGLSRKAKTATTTAKA